MIIHPPMIDLLNYAAGTLTPGEILTVDGHLDDGDGCISYSEKIQVIIRWLEERGKEAHHVLSLPWNMLQTLYDQRVVDDDPTGMVAIVDRCISELRDEQHPNPIAALILIDAAMRAPGVACDNAREWLRKAWNELPVG